MLFNLVTVRLWPHFSVKNKKASVKVSYKDNVTSPMII